MILASGVVAAAAFALAPAGSLAAASSGVLTPDCPPVKAVAKAIRSSGRFTLVKKTGSSSGVRSVSCLYGDIDNGESLIITFSQPATTEAFDALQTHEQGVKEIAGISGFTFTNDVPTSDGKLTPLPGETVLQGGYLVTVQADTDGSSSHSNVTADNVRDVMRITLQP